VRLRIRSAVQALLLEIRLLLTASIAMSIGAIDDQDAGFGARECQCRVFAALACSAGWQRPLAMKMENERNIDEEDCFAVRPQLRG
jgi:xanthine dehydrogenase molybdopterin-binding subunit B